MDKTTVRKSDLLEKLQENRKKHKEEYDNAKKIWVKKCTKALRKSADRAEKNGTIELHPLGQLPEPRHFLDSYDMWISRLEMEVKDEVELTETEFENLVMDDWNWRHQFASSTQFYNR